ncbi:MAG TPA: response regulator [Clostridia bacterium]|nr:response regulator [Clostridia bacterium]
MLRLMLVEDEENLRLSMRDLIDWPALGIGSVTLAADGPEALGLLSVCRPHIVLTDINMPGMSGLEMARAMLAAQPDLHVIFFSAYSDVDFLRQVLRMGSVDYLFKPLRSEELADAIARARNSLAILQRQHSSTRLLEDLGARLAPPVLGRLLMAQAPEEEIREQLLALGIEKGMDVAAVFTLTGFTAPDEALLYSCLRRVSLLSPERGMLLPLSHSIWSYVELLPQAPAPDWQQNIVRQLTLHLHLAGQVAAQVHPLPLADRLMSLYGAATQRMETLRDAQRDGQTRDAFRARQLCDVIQAYITAHYADRDLSASHIAKALHYTSAYICTIFKNQRQMTIHDYINLFRIAKAKELLTTTCRSITAIAQEVGYENDNYFARVFRKLESMSPGDYRKEHMP